jgi:hypothetical protein
MGRIVIVGKTEGVIGIEPAMIGVATLVGFSYLDHIRSFVIQLNSSLVKSPKTMLLG